MSFFSDLFGGADNAAKAQIGGIQAGENAAQYWTNAGNNILAQSTLQGLQPFQQNYNTAQQGVTQLGNVLGLNGPTASNNALTTLQATPGYQFALRQGDNAINAAAAASGTLGGGNQALALDQYNQNTAQNTYNSYVNSLQPYLGYSAGAASGIGGLYENQANVSNQNFSNLANLFMNAEVSKGNATASADLANQSLGLGLLGGGLNLAGSLFSDERLKEDITPVGELFDGTNIYSYRYKGDATPRIGVMAQEVQEKNPDAVREIGGYLAVDYGAATQYAAELGRFLEAA